MEKFMGSHFLLGTQTARTLYHEFAGKMPIIDYHCHLSPQEIAQDASFENIAQAILGKGNTGDHYIWRLMRAAGVDENEITGSAEDRVRFQRLAETMPSCIGNPVYHWLHLTLQRFFGVSQPLCPKTAEEIWTVCNHALQDGYLTARKAIERSRVEAICTTDDPADDLKWHKQIAQDPAFRTAVLPAMRPDRVLDIEKKDFSSYMSELDHVCNASIRSMQDLFAALRERMDYFAQNGCRVTDHGLAFIPWRKAGEEELNRIFLAARKGERPSRENAEKYQTAVMLFLGKEYAERNWAMQLHFGPLRNINARNFAAIGANTGFDAISDTGCTENLARYLSELDAEKRLPKTILFSIHPKDNAALAALAGCFQEGYGDKCHVQHGAAWWFNDTKAGMEAQISTWAAQSILGNSIGMLTDSRSFFSYTRHEYFRRILCNILGNWVENGEYPNDLNTLGRMVQNICFYNAKEYFGF